VASALLAALFATAANDLKRVLAYSTVSQLGYMVAGVGMGAIFESQLYLFSHAIFKALLFLGAGAIIHELGTRDMRQMGGLWRRMPTIAVPFLIGAAALVGIPFLNGFWSKELLLESAMEQYALTVYPALVLGAAITAFYAARMCRMVFFAPAVGEASTDKIHISTWMSTPVILLAGLVLISWVAAEPFAVYMQETLPFHVAHILPKHGPESLISMETVLALSTLITLSATAIGLFLGWRASAGIVFDDAEVSGLGRIEAAFNDSASAVVAGTQQSAALLQKTQTGLLNWNLAGIVLGLIGLLILILQGVW
jgi:NADH-quinone oxidoreductase subunit L